MDAPRTRQIVIIAQAVPADAADADPTGAEEAQPLPQDFANRAGWLAHINQVTLIDTPKKYPGVDVLSIIMKPGGVRDRILNLKAIRPQDGDFVSAIKTLSGRDANAMDVMGVRVMINNPFEGYNPQEVAAVKAQLEGYAMNGGAVSGEVRRIMNGDTEFRNDINKMRALSTQRGVQVAPLAAGASGDVLTAQMPPPQMPPTPDQGVTPLSVDKFESIEQLRQVLVALGPKKETYDRLFDLVGPDNEDSAKSALAKFFEGTPAGLCTLYDLLVRAGVASPIDQMTIGDLMDTHPNIFPKPDQTVGSGKMTLKMASQGTYIAEHEDGRTITASKDWDYAPLAKAFGWDGASEDSSGAMKFLEASVGKSAECGPMFGSCHETVKASFHGLYMPPSDSGLKTTVASGAIGSTINQNYSMHGPGDARFCPKVRNMVSTFICRYHCLDGLVIDDHQVLCGEAIWRQSVMDKFSREYKDADGNWVGGYLNKRFEIDRTTHEHPYQMKPGQRHAPINEDAWSTEKRLQEMRRDESKGRGYSDTPGDPKNVYNFDQHELAKGPKTPDLSEKGKDEIAKLASSGMRVVEADSMFKEAADPRFHGVRWAEPEPNEGRLDEDEERMISDFENSILDPLPPGSIAAGTWEGDPIFRDTNGGFWASTAFNEGYGKQLTEAEVAQFKADCAAGIATCTVPSGPQMPPAQGNKKFNFTKQAQVSPVPGGSSAMGDFDKVGQRAVRCSNPRCMKVSKMGTPTCPNCGAQTRPYHMSEILSETGVVQSPGIAASSDGVAMYANGVYRIVKDGRSYFGASIHEAQAKMRPIAPPPQGSVQEEANMLENIIQEDTGMMPPQLQPQVAPTDAQNAQPVQDVAPEVVPAVSDDVDGGIEEDLGLAPHVDATSLDEHLMQDMALEEPEERQVRTEEFASYGLEADSMNQA